MFEEKTQEVVHSCTTEIAVDTLADGMQYITSVTVKMGQSNSFEIVSPFRSMY